MSKTDIEQAIASCREQISRSKSVIADFDKGVRWLRGTGSGSQVDVTAKHRAREVHTIEHMQKLIAVYEKYLA